MAHQKQPVLYAMSSSMQYVACAELGTGRPNAFYHQITKDEFILSGEPGDLHMLPRSRLKEWDRQR